MWTDLRHLFRNLRRSPASAIAAVVTLAITLGSGTALFALLEATLLTPLPYADPDSLVTIGEVPLESTETAPRAARERTVEAWRERAGALLTQIEASDGTNLTLTGLGPAERVGGVLVTPGYLKLLGIAPAIGRGFTAEDAGNRIVVVSHRFWRSKLGGTRSALGQPIVLGAVPYTVVGVLPEAATERSDRDFWIPLAPRAPRQNRPVFATGRLAGTTTPAELARVLDEISRQSVPPSRALILPLRPQPGGNAEAAVPLLAAAAALAILMAAINLAALLLVRAMDRQRELAMRTALGAARREILKQVLLESHALALVGAAAGVLLAIWMTPAVGRLASEQFVGLDATVVTISWRGIAVLSITALACAWLCGLVPAVRAARQSGIALLGRGAGAAPRDVLWRRLFVGGEIALAVVLISSVLLVGQSLQRVLGVRPGFDAAGVMVMNLALPGVTYPDPQKVASFYSRLTQSIGERLGTDAVTVIDELPLVHDRGKSPVGLRPGHLAADAVVRTAGSRYFDVMRIPLIDGRALDDRDDATTTPRAVISGSLARRLFGDERAAGRQVWLAPFNQILEVVGVAGDVKHRSLDEPDLPTLYLSALQQPSNGVHVVVRSDRPPDDVVSIVRQETTRLDPQLPVYGVRPMSDVVSMSPGVPARRVLAACFAGFALLGLVIAGVGLFGLMIHDVVSRRTELALRIALGADPRQLRRIVLKNAAWVLAPGLAAGLTMSLATSQTLRHLLFGIGSGDTATMAAVVGVVSGVSLLAAVSPVRRALRTDPIAVLRAE